MTQHCCAKGLVRLGWVDGGYLAPARIPSLCWNTSHELPRYVHRPPGAASELGGAVGDAAAWRRLGRQLGRDFRKLFGLKRVKSLNEEFEQGFWSGASLNDLYASAVQNARNAGPMERILPAVCASTKTARAPHR